MANQFRLSITMNNIINSTELWSEHWEEHSDNLSQVKNEIIVKILDSLGIEIPEELKKQAAKEQAIDPHAYELLMKAKYAYINASNASDLDIAINPSSKVRPYLGFSNNNAGPASLKTREEISVISKNGDTSKLIRFNSPSFSKKSIKSRRSLYL